jgi:CRP-like cAMP-binding protein
MENLPPHGDVDGLGADVANYLAGQRVLTLATASGWGFPHAAMFCYVNDQHTFYIWTHPENVTARNIDINPAVSLTVGEYPPGWRPARGVQASGHAAVVLDPAEIRHAGRLFAAKFPGLLPDQLQNLVFLRIRPAELAFITNQAGDGDGGLATDFRRDPVYSVFVALPEQQADAIAGRLGRATRPAGTIIVRQGGPAEKFFIIVDGEVEVIREEGGSERVVATLGPGEFFGEVAILRDMPRTATVRAVTAVSLLTMDDRTFRSLVAQSLGITRDFDEIIRARMSDLTWSAR